MLNFLYVQRVKGFAPPTSPHFDDQTAERFAAELRRTRLYLEFGSGGSTVLADRMGVRTLSVEGDRFYAAAVRKALSPNTSVKILTPKLGLTEHWGMPVFKPETKGPRYIEAPFRELNGEFPDLVLVDARYRVACALATATRANRAGVTTTLIFDDYIGREHYHVVEDYLGRSEIVGRSAVFEVGRDAISDDVIERFAKDPR